MRFLAAAILAGVLLPGYANAANVTAYGNDTPFQLPEGDNLIDGPHTLTCKHPSGCLLTLSVYVVENEPGDSKSCIFVDGKNPMPKCNYDFSYNKRAFIHVSTGPHTVEMHIFNETAPSGETVSSWETEYTLYAKP